MTRYTALIFANGEVPDYAMLPQYCLKDTTLFAVDGGLRHALALGYQPDVLIGDFDSLPELTPEQQAKLERAKPEIVQHPRSKDETDLEIALQLAVEREYHQIIVVGALGGRLDQTLANLFLAADYMMRGTQIRMEDGMEIAFFVRAQAEIQARNGKTVSLIPWSVPARNVQTHGLRWELDSETLYPQQTRGISNEIVGESALVSIGSGLLLIVQRIVV